MPLRRLNRPIKSLAEKGRPGEFFKHTAPRVHPSGRVRSFHFTKGWRRWMKGVDPASIR